MKIKFLNAQVMERRIKRKADGREFTFREQEAVVEMGVERRIIVVSLSDDQAPYPPGEYLVLDGSFEVDRDRHLAFRRQLALEPVRNSTPSPASRLAG